VRYFLTLTLLLFMTTGCLQQVDLQWFDTAEDAIKHGLREEGITHDDIIGKVKKGEELFIIYKINLPNGVGVGVSSLSQKNRKFAWYRSSNPVIVKQNNSENNPEVSWVFTTLSNKKFMIYTGITHEKNITINTESGKNTPIINPKHSIYYYVEHEK
jgi:hypothetical protein